MKMSDILTPSFKTVRRVRDQRPMWQRRLSAESSFCKAVVSCGYLTQEQMERAVQRYRLGCSRDGGVIFWQIDQLDHVFDGKIMYYRPDCHRDHQRHPNWVSHLLKRHYGCQDLDIPSAHCLFGMHLAPPRPIPEAPPRPSPEGREASPRPSPEGREKASPTGGGMEGAAVVESEKTAVIMSELFPEYLWLASGGLHELTALKLFPLRHYRVVLFPDTDEHHESFQLWYDVAQEARRAYGIRCTVSPLLELKATPEQKARKIDLVDLLAPPLTHSRDELAYP